MPMRGQRGLTEATTRTMVMGWVPEGEMVITPKGSVVAEEDAEGVTAKAETLDEEFPGATARGNLIFWYVS